MTLEKVNNNETHLVTAFSSKERPYIQALTTRANYLLDKILNNSNSKEEKLEYHALKWALKELGGVNKEDLIKTPRPKPLKKPASQKRESSREPATKKE